MVWQNLFPTLFFGSPGKRLCYCIPRCLFLVPMEIHGGNIIFNLYHKQKYLFWVEITLDMNITENIIPTLMLGRKFILPLRSIAHLQQSGKLPMTARCGTGSSDNMLCSQADHAAKYYPKSQRDKLILAAI